MLYDKFVTKTVSVSIKNKTTNTIIDRNTLGKSVTTQCATTISGTGKKTDIGTATNTRTMLPHRKQIKKSSGG